MKSLLKFACLPILAVNGLGAANAAQPLTLTAATAVAIEGEGEGGDAALGKRVFMRCISCHSIKEGQNKVGPSLYGIIGREAGQVDGFKYSSANADSGITWSKDVLFEYLENPRGYMPGTKMIFPGLPKEDDRKNVIAYLESVAE